MHYRSIATLNDDVLEWSRRLPHDVDLVVGVPRSGLLVANLLALHLNVPFTDVEGLIAGRMLAGGNRLSGTAPLLQGERKLRILVVDDSLWSGGSLAKTRALIENALLPHQILYGAVYIVPEAADKVDTYHSKVPVPRAFEWNILHHPSLEESCVALEGVLLPEQQIAASVTPEMLAHVKPIYRPTKRLGCIVAVQPEEARAAIAGWLAERDIPYNVLAIVSPKNRDAEDVLRDKASLYRRSRAWMFLEGSEAAAKSLANASGRPSYCFATRRMYYPGYRGAAEYPPSGAMQMALNARDFMDRIHSKIFGRDILGKGQRRC